MMDYIKKKLELLPDKPGCYLMKNKDNVVIYVGKAKKLKRRVSSYFNRIHTGKTARLVSEIRDFEYIVVESETESLILEINLIKKYDPKYNILLRDDKSYPYIELTNEEVPRLLIVRNLGRKKKIDRLYGPYPNVTAARQTVNLLNRIYPLRKCKTYEKKLCLYYHIGQCLGYCKLKQNKEKIKIMEKEIIEFLKGNHEYVTTKLEKQMNNYSEKLEFEKALEIKEMLDYIKITLTRQKVEISDNVDRDIIGYYEFKGYLSIQIFFIRSGKIQERISKTIPIIDDVNEELTRFIATFYTKNILIPKEILVPNIVDDNILEEYLKTNVKAPVKGVKSKLIEMANENAKIKIENDYELIEKDENRTYLANEELRKILNMNKLDRIELFDNSNLFGTFNVSGMVVFKNGLKAKNEYRKYKITNDKNDDYGTMKEVIYRRYFRVLKDNLEKPDLIIVDGGIGQINVAREVINSLALNIKVVGLKKDDKHTTEALLANDPIEEIKIDKKSNLFYYLERMQDEVHNFTISYHKNIRSKGAISSILDNVEGIGEKRKKDLLKKYKTITNLKKASLEELEKILPKNISLNLYNFLKDYKEK
ncbi:MAG: excinuclease ABC subunit UvrC [Bacilli bacterium]|nr:excinuclease ABC subunit UvrC [Bacilli bacterium]